MLEAAHPVPDEAGRRGALQMLETVRGLGADDLVIALVSGGGSALRRLPARGPGLRRQAADQPRAVGQRRVDRRDELRAQAPLGDQGRAPARCVRAGPRGSAAADLRRSGDTPEVIASGPTLPDPSTCADALAIVDRYRIALPPAARAGLESGAYESPKPGDARFAGHSVRMIATPQQSLEAAAALARQAGIDAHILSDEMEGESREVGKVHAALARAVARRGAPFAKPCVILSGGETTVTVKSKGGRGGRATEFLLGCAIALQGEPAVHVLAADTDGIDGIEDNAGAIVAPDTLARAAALGLKPAEFLDRNDAYNLFRSLGDLVITGPTFTNVNDFRALLVV